MASALANCQWLLPLDGGSLPDKALIGGKGWSIANMFSMGLPVPPAFVITTEACKVFLDTGKLPAGLADELVEAMAWLEELTGRRYGGTDRPLLV